MRLVCVPMAGGEPTLAQEVRVCDSERRRRNGAERTLEWIGGFGSGKHLHVSSHNASADWLKIFH